MTYGEITINASIKPKKGKSGVVKFGVHATSNLDVAIKYLTTRSPDALERFKQENEILHELEEHENVILPYSKVFTNENGLNLPYYIMERGDDGLLDWLNRYPADEDLLYKRDMLVKICRAVLSIQEKGYIHRDLHEDNILIKYVNDDPVPKIMDFGRSYKKHGTFEGSDEDSPSWGYYLMPPEIEFGLIKHDDPSHMLGDAYAIGLLIKTMLSYDTPTNIGHLLDMKKKIIRFKNAKNDNQGHKYTNDRSLEDRRNDYNEWCMQNDTWSQRWLKIDLATQEQSDLVTELIRNFSNINQSVRRSDLNVAIDTLKGL